MTLQNGVYYTPPTTNQVYDTLLMMDNKIYLFKIMPSLCPIYRQELEEQLAMIQDQLGSRAIHYVYVAPSYLPVKPQPFKKVKIRQYLLPIDFVEKARQNAMDRKEKQRQLELAAESAMGCSFGG